MLALGAALVMAVAACSGGDGDGAESSPSVVASTIAGTTVLRTDLVAAAIAAVEAERGGAQRYTEVNANADGVTLFVAVDDATEVAYFYGPAALEPPGAHQALSGPAFTLEGVDRDLAPELVRRTEADLAGSTVTALALVQPADLGLVWALRSRSARGGLLDVFYNPTGELLSVSPSNDG